MSPFRFANGPTTPLAIQNGSAADDKMATFCNTDRVCQTLCGLLIIE